MCAKGFSRKPALAEHVAVHRDEEQGAAAGGGGGNKAARAASDALANAIRVRDHAALFVIEEN